MPDTIHRTITDLNQVHRQLEELFYRHQVALLQNHPTEAVELLQKYEKCVFHHMKEEEDILLPIYRQKGGELRGGDPELFFAEHKKIQEWLNRIRVRLQRLSPVEPDFKAVIALFDDEAYFKKYMEHHSLREDRIFYPELDRLLGEKDRLALLRLLSFSIEEMGEAN